MTIFKACLITADALIIATTDSEVAKVLGVVGIILLVLSSLKW